MKRAIDSDFELDSLAHDGFMPITISVGIAYIQDETPDSYQGPKSFWSYEIITTNAFYINKLGETVDYTDQLDDDHWLEIHEACVNDLTAFKRGIA